MNLTKEEMREYHERLVNAKEVFNTMIDNCIELFIEEVDLNEYQKELDKRFRETYQNKYNSEEMRNIAGNIRAMGSALMYQSLSFNRDN